MPQLKQKSTWDSEKLVHEQKSILQISNKGSEFRTVFDVGFFLLLIGLGLGGWQINNYAKGLDRAHQYVQVTEDLGQLQNLLQQAQGFVFAFRTSQQKNNLDQYNLLLPQITSQMNSAKKQAAGLGLDAPVFTPLQNQIQVSMNELNEQILGTADRKTASEMEFKPYLNLLHEKMQSEKINLNRESKFIFSIIGVMMLIALAMLLFWQRWFVMEKQKWQSFSALLEDKQKELFVAEQIAVEADEVKTQFLNNMSHEIRTPLNAIMGLSELLSRSKLNETQDKMVQGMLSAGKSLLELVNVVLDFAKIDNQGLDLHLEYFYLQDTLQELEHILRGPSELKGLNFNVQSSTSLPRVQSDPLRIRQVLLNLAGNAIKFTAEGSVRIQVQQIQKLADSEILLRFEVVDSGQGIPESAKDKIFQNFYQTDASIGRKFGGTGLGLSIAKVIVEKMRGRIGFESISGKGTTFWFEIPVQAHMQTENTWRPQMKVSTEKSKAVAGGKKALVVDDNPLNQMVLSGYLEELGISSVVCSSGLKTLELLKDSAFEWIFLDCQMPGMDGFQTTAEIRKLADAKSRKTFIIATTAHSIPGYREKCLQAGMDEYLSKPIQFEVLEKLVREPLAKNIAEEKITGNPDVRPVQASEGLTTESVKRRLEIPSVKPVVTIEEVKSAQQAAPPAQKTSDVIAVADAPQVPQLNKARWDRWRKLPSEKGNFLQEMLKLFTEFFDLKLASMQEDFKNQRLKSIAEAAHFLKSSCSDIGAEKLAEICEQIETVLTDAGTAVPPNLEALLVSLAENYAQVQKEIQSDLRRTG